MTNHYKQMCLCEICQAFSMLKSALNRVRNKASAILDKKWKNCVEKTPRQRTRKTESKAEYLQYKWEVFDAVDALNPKGRYAPQCITCESPDGFQGTGTVRFECAAGTCKHCPPTYPRPSAEEK